MVSIPELRAITPNSRRRRGRGGYADPDDHAPHGPGPKAVSPCKNAASVPGRVASSRSLAARGSQKRLQLRHQTGEHFQR